MPVRWGLNGRGMKDHGEMTEEGAKAARRVWMDARDAALRQAHKMLVLGEQPHKQIVNRILEPFAHIRVVVTASSFANFFTQRCDDAADPTINALAKAMYAAFKVSTPKVLAAGMWHLPYIQQFEWDAIDEASLDQDKMMNLLKVSVARCARTSYRLKNGMVSTFEDDLLLYDRLVTDTPVHGSPAEHQATPDTCRLVYEGGKLKRIFDMPELSGNLGPGWVQYRQTLPNQNIIEYLQEDAAWLT